MFRIFVVAIICTVSQNFATRASDTKITLEGSRTITSAGQLAIARKPTEATKDATFKWTISSEPSLMISPLRYIGDETKALGVVVDVPAQVDQDVKLTIEVTAILNDQEIANGSHSCTVLKTIATEVGGAQPRPAQSESSASLDPLRIGETADRKSDNAPLVERIRQIIQELDVNRLDVRFIRDAERIKGQIDKVLSDTNETTDGLEFAKRVYAGVKPIIDDENMGLRGAQAWRDFFSDVGAEAKSRNIDPRTGMRTLYLAVSDALGEAPADRQKQIDEAARVLAELGYSPGSLAAGASSGSSGKHRVRCFLHRR